MKAKILDKLNSLLFATGPIATGGMNDLVKKMNRGHKVLLVKIRHANYRSIKNNSKVIRIIKNNSKVISIIKNLCRKKKQFSYF